MDGPNVNLKFFKEFAADFKEDNFCSLVGNRQSAYWSQCLQDRSREVGMGPEEIFKAAYTILHDSPGCREDYESVTGSSKYLLNFCATR